MENSTEVVEPQKTTAEPATPPAEPVVQLTQAELDDLKHKAEVSSQNYERAKKLEAKIKELETLQTPSEDVFSDEGKLLKKELDATRAEIAEMRAESARKDLQSSNPIFREKWDEFEAFRENPENKGMNLRTAAKAFLAEKGFLEAPRKGLEKPTGGDRKPMQTGMTSEDKLELMKNNPKEWQRLIREGKI